MTARNPGKEHYINQASITISQDVYQAVYDSQGQFFHTISRVDPHVIAEDVLNPEKSVAQARLFERFTSLKGKRLLEVGSGFAVNHVVWQNKFKIDGYGIEPGEEGFNASLQISRQLVRENNMDPNRIINAVGENIPFDDNHFDLVYSTNVLEHTQDPGKVLTEIIRVLKPGGIAQIVFPNYHSFYDGHYNIFHPPIYSNQFFRWLIKNIYRRDPGFAESIRTELNPSWCKKQLRPFVNNGRITILGMGQDVFSERLTDIDFSHWRALARIEPLFKLGNRIGINWLASKMVNLCSAWTPIILTLRKCE